MTAAPPVDTVSAAFKVDRQALVLVDELAARIAADKPAKTDTPESIRSLIPYLREQAEKVKAS